MNNTKFMPRYYAQPYEFSGVVTTNVRFYTSANLYLSGTNSTAQGSHIIDGGLDMPADGFLRLKSFGKKGMPSSIGAGTAIALGEYGGRVQFMGTEPETCDKNIKLSHETAGRPEVKSVIDGGAYGGLTLSGDVSASADKKLMQRLVLSGSNRVECVYSGSSTYGVKAYDAKKQEGPFTNRIHITKAGTGTWRFTHSTAREGISGVTVKEGVLAFDTLAEIGVNCSFGTGLLGFYPDVCEKYNAANQIPYQFILGDAAADTIGTLALGSSNGSVCVTRPFAIAGNGSISNGQASARLCVAGVSPLTASGKKTLILDGSSTADNQVQDVTNDVNGVLSVVKRGSGKWILSGNQTFGGDLRVEGGELVVQKTTANQPFSWYRLVLKENWGEYKYGALCDSWAKYTFVLQTKGFALYDADGNNLAADCVTQISDYASLAVNEGAYMNDTRADLDYRKPNGVNQGTNFCAMIKGDNRWVGGLGSARPERSKPATWITLDLRLPAASHVVAVDFKPQYGYDHNQIDSWDRRKETSQSWWNYAANIKYFNMYGSVDGVRWEPLFNEDVYCEGTNYSPSVWFFGDAYSTGAAKGLKFDHVASSRPAATVLPNVGTVSASNGGILRVEGEPITVRSLEVGLQSGGTISNVTFAANGTLHIRGAFDGSDITLPGTYQDVNGFGNIAGWTLDAGEKSGRYAIANQGGVLHLVRRGLTVIVR